MKTEAPSKQTLGLIDGMGRASTVPYYCEITQAVSAQGAQAILLGCTEIAMRVQHQDCALPLLETTELHARRAALWAMSSTGLGAGL